MRSLDVDGTRIPALGLGTWQLEGRACERAVHEALALGYRHVDTAQVYENESAVGRGIAAAGVDRGDVFLVTKLWREHLRAADVARTTRASLKRLGTDYVDLLLIHWPSDVVPLAETLEAMHALQEEGLTRALGVSNFPVAWVEEARRIAPIVCNQVEYHPMLDQRRLRAGLRRHGIPLVAYSPLAHGHVHEEPELRAIAREHGASPAQMALRWLLDQEGVAVIPKATSREHLAENLGALELSLSDEDRRRIDALGRQGLRTADPPWAPKWD